MDRHGFLLKVQRQIKIAKNILMVMLFQETLHFPKVTAAILFNILGLEQITDYLLSFNNI